MKKKCFLTLLSCLFSFNLLQGGPCSNNMECPCKKKKEELEKFVQKGFPFVCGCGCEDEGNGSHEIPPDSHD